MAGYYDFAGTGSIARCAAFLPIRLHAIAISSFCEEGQQISRSPSVGQTTTHALFPWNGLRDGRPATPRPASLSHAIESVHRPRHPTTGFVEHRSGPGVCRRVVSPLVCLHFAQELNCLSPTQDRRFLDGFCHIIGPLRAHSAQAATPLSAAAWPCS